jgi:hypothetical protein
LRCNQGDNSSHGARKAEIADFDDSEIIFQKNALSEKKLPSNLA